mmetsp:Transcript_58840/g.119816  ORF Transcript_58840/g.119816 Transcript_58840/m.119816 type:complete len:206 (-) Transcript_58840:183-800(-)
MVRSDSRSGWWPFLARMLQNCVVVSVQHFFVVQLCGFPPEIRNPEGQQEGFSRHAIGRLQFQARYLPLRAGRRIHDAIVRQEFVGCGWLRCLGVTIFGRGRDWKRRDCREQQIHVLGIGRARSCRDLQEWYVRHLYIFLPGRGPAINLHGVHVHGAPVWLHSLVLVLVTGAGNSGRSSHGSRRSEEDNFSCTSDLNAEGLTGRGA